MGKPRSPNRDKAFEIYKEHEGKISPKEVAELIDESVVNIYTWKKKDEWDIKLHGKVGAPKGNRNAIGNNGGAPKGNLNNLQHGNYYDPTKHLKKDFLKKYLPTATKKIIKGISESGIDTLDILWVSIELQLAAVVRSQQIMHVDSKSEMIKELKKTKVSSEVVTNKKTQQNETIEVYREEEFQFEFAWNRQATFITAQSKALTTLQNLISKYEELLHKNWDKTTEEQKLRIEKLKTEISMLTKEENDEEEIQDDGFIKALSGSAKEDWSDEEEN